MGCGRGPWATIAPSPILAGFATTGLHDLGPQHVATITLTDDPTQYGPDWTNYFEKFDLTKVGDIWTTDVWLRRTTGPPESTVGAFGSGSPGLDAKAVEVVKMSHGAVGSVRWRWLDDDEGAWVYCVDGCCSVQGE